MDFTSKPSNWVYFNSFLGVLLLNLAVYFQTKSSRMLLFKQSNLGKQSFVKSFETSVRRN